MLSRTAQYAAFGVDGRLAEVGKIHTPRGPTDEENSSLKQALYDRARSPSAEPCSCFAPSAGRTRRVGHEEAGLEGTKRHEDRLQPRIMGPERVAGIASRAQETTIPSLPGNPPHPNGECVATGFVLIPSGPGGWGQH